MQGSVETAKRLLEQGNCVGVNCIKDCCPLDGEDDPCCDCTSGLSDAAVRKSQEFIKENEKMLDLTKNQIVEPPVKCWVKGNDHKWKQRELRAIDHRDHEPFKVFSRLVNDEVTYKECSLTDPTVHQYRPLNAEELSCMVGTVLAAKNRQHISLTTGFNTHFGTVYLDDQWWKADDILKYWLRLDGSPVGVLIK